MKIKLIKTTAIIALIYTIAYFLTVHYGGFPSEVEGKYFVLVVFVTLGVGAIYLEEHFLKLFLLLLIPLVMGMSLYGFVIIDLLDHTCTLCGQVGCGHTQIDCDGSCYGWYTFENEPKWILTQYFFDWFLAVFLVYFLKGFRWLVGRKR